MSSDAWVWLAFDEAVRDQTAGSPRIQRRDVKPVGDVPVVDQGQQQIAGYTDKANVYIGALPVVLFGDHTRAFKFIDYPFAIGADGAKVLEPQAGIDAKFLYYYLRSLRIESAGYSRHFKFLREFKVPKPPATEQRRIVDLLARAEGIVRLRREAAAKAAELIPALFVHHFGDPATNPMGWPVEPVANVGRVQLGRQRTPKYQTGKFTCPYVRVANVHEDRIDVSDLLSMDFDERDFATYRLEFGDILLNEGQSIELVGRPAMWRDEVPDCCFQNTLVRFQADRSRVIPEYMLAALLERYRSGALSRISSKTSNVAHLGAARFAKLPVMVPSLDLQEQFRARALLAESIKKQQTTALAKAQSTFDALLAQAFAPT